MKTNWKLKVLTIATAFGAAISAMPVHAQIPVTDGAAIAQSQSNFLQEIAKWTEQIKHMESQLSTMKQQYEAISGSRGLGDIMNNPDLKQYLPADWQQVYDSVRNGGYAGLTGSGKSVYDKNKLFDGCKGLQEEQRKVCEANATKGAVDQGFALDAFDKAAKRVEQIQQLMGKINSTSDQKAIAELQARIASEQAMIQNEQVKMQLFQMVSAAQDRIQEQREREVVMKDASRTGRVKFKASTF